MRIFDKQLNLLLTPGARTEIQQLTEEQTPNEYELNIHMTAIMSKYYEMNQHFWNKSHKENPVTVEELRAISQDEYDQMVEVMKQAIKDANKRMVEVADGKKKPETASTSTQAGSDTTDTE